MMNGTAGPCFVDTNVFVYAITLDDERCPIAQQVIAELSKRKSLRTSTQVLQELYVVATRKLRRCITSEQALAYIDRLVECPVVVNDVPLIREAARLSASDSISFWDALLIAAARRARAARLYTEDLQHGRKIHGIEIVNPFLKAS